MIEKTYVMPHPPIILIDPIRSKEIAATKKTMEDVASDIAKYEPDTIIVISPHTTTYLDYIHISPGAGANGSLAQFDAPNIFVDVEYDEDFVTALEEISARADISAGTLGETDPALDHASVIPLWFIADAYNNIGRPNNYRIVRIGLSGQSDAILYKFGECIRSASDIVGRKTVVVASADLSHKLTHDGPYGFAPEGPELDGKIVECLQSGSFLDLFKIDRSLAESGAECGLRSIKIISGALDGKDVQPELLSYEGPFGVGYAVAKFEAKGNNSDRMFLDQITDIGQSKVRAIRENEDPYVKLARESIEFYVRNNRRMLAPEIGLPREMIDKAAGVFVSLKKDGHLRGCIGTTEPNQTNIATEIIHNSVSAAANDPRFDPVEESELPYIIYSVDVIMKPEPIESIDELDPKKYGVVVSSGFKYALLLPDLEGIDTVDQQLEAVMQKAGITKSKEKDKMVIEKFTVVRHK